MKIFKALFKAKMHKLLGTETSYAGIHFKKNEYSNNWVWRQQAKSA